MCARKAVKYASDLHLDRDWIFAPGQRFQLDYDFLTETFPDNQCWLVALDDWKINILLSLLKSVAPFYKNWGFSHSSTWDEIERSKWDEIEAFISETELCLMSGCDVSQMNEYLERIAIALESIDEKAVERITWQEMIEDLEDTLGIGNALVAVIKWIGDLFPRVRVKLDMAPVVLGLWEWFRWKAPLLALLGGINASIGAIAALLAAEKPLSILRTIFDGFNSLLNLNNRIYEFVLGSWNWYDDVLKPLWDSFISDDEGGTGGDNPDADPDLRSMVNLFVEQEAMTVTQSNQQIVNCGGIGLGCDGGYGLGDESGVGSFLDDGEYTQGDPDLEESPPAGFDSWSDFFEYKCKAANAMFLGFVESVYVLGDLGSRTYPTSSLGAIRTVVRTILETMGGQPGYWLLSAGEYATDRYRNAIAWLSEKISLPIYNIQIGADVPLSEMSEFDIFFDLRLDWISDQEDRVCELYNAETTDEARDAILDAIDTYFSGYSYDAGVKTWAREVIEGTLTNAWLNILFTEYAVITGYDDPTAIDCSVCEGDCEAIAIRYGSLVSGNTYQSEYVDPSNGHRIALRFYCLPSGVGNWEESGKSVQLSNPDGITAGSWPVYRLVSQCNYVWGCTGVDIYCGNTMPTEVNCLKKLTIASATAFTIDIAIGSDCEPE